MLLFLTPFNTLLLHFQACQAHSVGATAKLAPLCFGQRCLCLDPAVGMVAPALTSLGSAGLVLFLSVLGQGRVLGKGGLNCWGLAVL